MTGPQSVEGLITRIGKWLDRRFQAKATQEELRYYFNAQENASIKDKVELMQRCDNLAALIAAAVTEAHAESSKLKTDIELIVKSRADDKLEKEVADLKTRLEKMELYSGMTRKVDPTKPPVVKSAFQM